jgi:addiction module RelE/StbE family toxin
LKLRWTNPALRDLEEIGDYFARDDKAAAVRNVAAVFDRVDLRTDQPLLGRSGRVAGTRELVVSDTPYIAAYRVLGDEVQILAVLHGARRWQTSFV